MKKTLDYGNCIDCGYYGCLNLNRRCRACAEREHLLIDAALDTVKKRPAITAEELAEVLEMDSGRIYDWISKGMIRCVATKFECPRCGTTNINRFSCHSCGFEPAKAQPSATQKTANPKRMVIVNSRKMLRTGS